MSHPDRPLLADLVANPCRITTTEPRAYDFSQGWIEAENRARRIEAALRQIIREELQAALLADARPDPT